MSEGSSYQAEDASKVARELFGGKLGVKQALEKLRTRLLDLTLRNKLLNYKHPKGRSFQFTANPDLDLVFERLEEGRAVPIEYVPDPPTRRYDNGKKPEARVYARELGIGTSVDISPSSGSTSHKRLPNLQVLQYPVDLERISRKIASEARTVIEETGANMLYLMFGYLEYFDSEDSEKPLLAPLLSMPVALNRGNIDGETRTYTYELTHTGEDVTENVTLREKLRQQFRLEFPELDDEDTPEQYFSKVEKAFSKQKNWCVRRRLSLGFLSFGKLAIWKDLDPANGQTLLESQLLKNIFDGGEQDASGGFHAEDYDIDKHADGDLPLIYDADSSQHSALIDVKNGKNLVINGPPGTGKSQTITNIIATAVSSGKKVLFVSEKLAALEVVKQRLQAAGLGDFCLELHSHKTQKKQLLASIEERMSKQFRKPSGYEQRAEVLRERRGTLNTYAALLGSREGNKLDLTIHEVLWTSERKRQALGSSTVGVAALQLPSADSWSSERIDRCRTILSSGAGALQELGQVTKDSPWIGYAPNLLIKGDELPILQTIESALKAARMMHARVQEIAQAFDCSPWSLSQMEEAVKVTDLLGELIEPVDEELLTRMFSGGLTSIDRVKREAKRLAEALERVRGLQGEVATTLNRSEGVRIGELEKVSALAVKSLSTKALSLSREQLRPALESLEQQLALVGQLTGERSTLVPSPGDELKRKLHTYSQDDSLRRLEDESAKSLIARAGEALPVLRNTQAAILELSQLLSAAKIPFSGKADEVGQLVSGKGLAELQPDARASTTDADALRDLVSRGWADWTAARFTDTSGHISEILEVTGDALEQLRSVMGRLGLPLDTSKASLEALEVLLAIAEGAPRELLGSRGPGYERADFADIAIRAEEDQKNLAYRRSKVEHAFHVDTLPDIGALKSYVAVFRRGDGLLNFLKKDWRQATAAFKACSKSTSRPNASGMAERFSAVLAWRTSTEQYESDAQLQSILGSLFLGTRTDFDKVRRLHKWVRESHEALMPTQLATAVNVASWAEGNFALLATNANRVRGWLSKISQLSKFVKELPGFDPALLRARRAEELIKPLGEYAETLNQGAKSLKAVARPTASVQRALELIELTNKLDSQKDALLSLVSAPSELAKVGGSLGLSESELVYQHIAAALPTLTNRAKQISELGETLSAGLGAEYSLRSGLPALEGILLACELANDLLFTGGTARQRMLNELLAQRTKQLSDGLSVSSFVEEVGLNSVSVEKVLSGAHAYVESQNRLKVVAEDPSFLGLFEPVLDGVQTDETSIALCIARAKAVSQLALHLPHDAGNRLLSVGSAGTARALQEAVAGYVTSFSAYKAAMEGLEKWGKLDWVSWRGYPSSSDAVAKLERAHAGGGSLVSWSKFLAAKEEAGSQGVGEILLRAEGGDLTPSEIVPAFEYVFFRSLSRGILTRHKELARFTGSGHEQLRSNFAQLDKELIALNGALYAAKVDAAKRPIPGVSSGRASDLTEMSLLTKETKKQKRHIPIRQLMQRAGRSLQELKPCFMMGPLSVAQYLEQGKLTFDLIVMDEASQLRPEDALGAIARGRQLVVVGDPKQLPPTNFFDRLMEDDEDDAEDASSVVEGVESILGICEHLYRPVRTLRWHYRSKHESLIAFSNSQFYDHRLVVFPSPYRRNRKLGVNYRYVKEGLYKDRRNFPEAQRVVDAVLEHIVTSPEESLGVVTLNQTQRQLIEDILDAKVRDIKAVSDYFEKHEKAGWPFFVKNLENVQGDERDVIFVSTTFGRPGPGEQIRQNFGPINRADGWRRLNVLFTRSRRRIDLFTSLQPNDVRLDEKTSLGKKALQDYLTFASTGRLPGSPGTASGREADSEFEIAVADALRMRGYDTEPQVGVAGYFLDLGVRHPERRSEYLAGIECDGVTYHSSLSARDRDRIRQEVLESLGWHGRIIRVWSTDWFADPDAQTDRLVTFLEQRRRQDESSPSPYSDDDLEFAEAISVDEAAMAALREPESDEQASSNDIAVVVEPRLFIEVGDRVTYETASPVERHTVTIVDSPSNLKLGLLSDQTPLAQALQGLCAGDNAELRVKGNEVRGIRIIRVERSTDDGWVAEEGD